MPQTDLEYMKSAYEEAIKALQINEVPIGCVIVYDEKIIGCGYNRRRTDKNVLAHAEIQAIAEACAYMNDWRLEGCRLFVTIEPCPMCAGAIVQARMQEVIYGADNPKAGCAGSILNLLNIAAFNHQTLVSKGVMRDECAKLMRDFFKVVR